MTAVGSNGSALEFVDYSLSEIGTLVLLAVRSHGGALEFASAKLKGTRSFVCVFLQGTHRRPAVGRGRTPG